MSNGTGYQSMDLAPYRSNSAPINTDPRVAQSQQLSYGGNTNYPSYQGGNQNLYQSGGGMASEAGDKTMANSRGNKYAMIAGGISKTAGSVMQIYGAYKARKEAKAQYKRDLKAWENAEIERKTDKSRELKRQEGAQGYLASNFGQNLESNLANRYPGYRTGS